MDGGYYKAFQKCLSRPIALIFNKIFSHPTKQSGPGLFRKRSIHISCERVSPPRQVLPPTAMEMCQIHERRGLQRVARRSSEVAEASGKDLAMTAIKNSFKCLEMTARTLRHIDAVRFLQEAICDEV